MVQHTKREDKIPWVADTDREICDYEVVAVDDKIYSSLTKDEDFDKNLRSGDLLDDAVAIDCLATVEEQHLRVLAWRPKKNGVKTMPFMDRDGNVLPVSGHNLEALQASVGKVIRHDSGKDSNKTTVQQESNELKGILPEEAIKEMNDRFHDINNREKVVFEPQNYRKMKQEVETIKAKLCSECLNLRALSNADRVQKKLQDAIQDLQYTKERNEQLEKDLEVLSKSADQYVTELRGHVQYADYYQLRLATMECKLDVSELTCGFEDFVERRRLKKEAGRGDAFLASAHECEERRWKKKFEKAEEDMREARARMREQKARSFLWSWR
ncbi:hypothetical protein FPHYL_6995 [Fusarium phyllophilum]|uniref:Uncharacterized protein n=1 Tax=Fusarium phyllophilum TaxID=47803 RepID=A0A8H5JRS3_9HYPO|nr:hypothetical protein FPHYL_6995 [Fusarium phyllophilum]